MDRPRHSPVGERRAEAGLGAGRPQQRRDVGHCVVAVGDEGVREAVLAWTIRDRTSESPPMPHLMFLFRNSGIYSQRIMLTLAKTVFQDTGTTPPL